MRCLLRPLSVACLAALLPACADSPTAPVTRASINNSATGNFDPQPDPPAFSALFAVTGDPTESMRGAVSDASCVEAGAVIVTNLQPAVEEGVILHVLQSWSFVPPGPCRSPGTLLLQGTLNQASGKVVLTGESEDGTPAQVRGTFATVAGGTEIQGRVVVQDPNLRGVEDANQ